MPPHDKTQTMSFDPIYTPVFDNKTKKLKYKKDPKNLRYAECHECGIRLYHKYAIDVIKCNICGFVKKEETKIKKDKSRCAICNKKRKTRQYINGNEIEKMCDKCLKGIE